MNAITITFRSLSRGRYRCNQTGELTLHPKKYREQQLKKMLVAENRQRRLELSAVVITPTPATVTVMVKSLSSPAPFVPPKMQSWYLPPLDGGGGSRVW